MKKTLIALLALGGMAMAAESTVITTVLPTSAPTNMTYTKTEGDGWEKLEWNNINANNIRTNLEKFGILNKTEGDYYFMVNGTDDSQSDFKTVTFEGNKVVMTGRYWGIQQDSFYVNVATVRDLLGEHTLDTVTVNSFTLSTTVQVTSNADSWWGVYTLSPNGTFTQIQDLANDDTGSNSDLRGEKVGTNAVKKSVTLQPEQLTNLTEDTVFFTVYRNAYKGDKPTLNISDLSYSLNVTVPESPSVPEPTTATLSLLALAGLAARRRRR